MSTATTYGAFATLLLISVSYPALAAPKGQVIEHGPQVAVVAQVGDEAISSVDLSNRIKFVIVTAHLSDTPDVVQNIRPHVIRSLVDEKLQVQEAVKNDIKVTDKDIDEAIGAIEQQRSMPPGAITKMLQENNVPKETFVQQVRAQLSWSKLLTRKIRPQVHVSDTEIGFATTQILTHPPEAAQESALPQEYKIGVVALPVDKPSRENEIKHLGDKLVREVRSGANFEEVSRQFSSMTASAGGKVETFWVSLDQVEPHIAKALRGAKAGAIIDPVRTEQGFTIVKIYETRALGGKTAPKAKEAPKASENKPANRDQIFGMLMQQKMELEAQKYLRNLRRETFIDIR